MNATMTKKRPVGRPSAEPVPKAVLHVEIPPELKKAIEELADQNDRKITAEVIRALQQYCREGGTWPPQAEE